MAAALLAKRLERLPLERAFEQHPFGLEIVAASGRVACLTVERHEVVLALHDVAVERLVGGVGPGERLVERRDHLAVLLDDLLDDLLGLLLPRPQLRP